MTVRASRTRSGFRLRLGFGVWLMAGFGCSSSSSRVVGEACGAGESVVCQTPSSCPAIKVCSADGKGYGPCLCVPDGGGAGASGGSAGSAGGGNAGAGGADASRGNGGMSGVSGTDAGTTDGDASDGASGGSGGAAGGDSGPCLKCLQALEQAVPPSDPRICPASRAAHAALYNCVCATGGPCESQCMQHCIDPNSGFPAQCQSCSLANCGNLAVACQTN